MKACVQVGLLTDFWTEFNSKNFTSKNRNI